MRKLTRYFLAGLAGLTGLALFTVTTDREFINLTPSPAQFVTLENNHAYTQTFPATRTSLSRVGVYVRPVGDLPASAVQLTVARNGTPVATQTIPTAAIDIESTSQVRFPDPLPVVKGDQISLTLTVPDNLTGRVRALQRLPDETFNSAYAVFTIDGQPQSSPLAYQVYYAFQPPLAFQIGGLLLLAGAVLVLARPLNSPAMLGIVAAILSVLYALPAILLGDLPIVLMLVIACVFFAAALIARRYLPTTATLLTATITALTTYWPLRLANPPLRWEHFGSYVGILAAILAGIGLAFFAGAGLNSLNHFLGNDKLSRTLLALIFLLILLDLFHVGAAPLEFGLL